VAEQVKGYSSETKYRPQVLMARLGSFDTQLHGGYDADKAVRCERNGGHVLQISSATEIRCINCPACWKNEGF
jgi:hypothetical protein